MPQEVKFPVCKILVLSRYWDTIYRVRKLPSKYHRDLNRCHWQQTLHCQSLNLLKYLVLSTIIPVSYTHLRAHETRHDLVCRLLLEKKKKKNTQNHSTA